MAVARVETQRGIGRVIERSTAVRFGRSYNAANSGRSSGFGLDTGYASVRLLTVPAPDSKERAMFQVAFDFDFKEYQSKLAQYQRTNTKPYHFSAQERDLITKACELLGRASARVILPLRDPVRDLLMTAYFGAQSDQERSLMLLNLKALDGVIQDQGRKVTFADGSDRHMQIKMNPNNIDQYPTWRSAPMTTQEMEGAGAWVHTLPGGAPSHGAHHVGSGMRIILGQAWSQIGTLRGQAATIYHELTHKILGTNDHQYGEIPCKRLPKDMARRNADNYGLFIEEYMRAKWIS